MVNYAFGDGNKTIYWVITTTDLCSSVQSASCMISIILSDYALGAPVDANVMLEM